MPQRVSDATVTARRERRVDEDLVAMCELHVGKPGGFARYVQREEMFPQPVFRG